MHESSLAKTLLSAVLEAASQAGAKRVLRVRGRLAETEHLNADAIAFHFAAHARDSIAEHATLSLELVHVRARCLECAGEYAPEHHVTLCPSCGSTRAELLSETGVRIDDMEVE